MRSDPIKELGGIRPAARKLGVPVSTVAHWSKAGVPSWRWPQIEATLRTEEDFENHERGQDDGAEH